MKNELMLLGVFSDLHGKWGSWKKAWTGSRYRARKSKRFLSGPPDELSYLFLIYVESQRERRRGWLSTLNDSQFPVHRITRPWATKQQRFLEAKNRSPTLRRTWRN